MKDALTNRAQREGFRARSVYKLQEIQRKFPFLRGNVLDIGCWPGSWLQWIRQNVDGMVVGVDQLKIDPIPGVDFIQRDIFDDTLLSDIRAICPHFDTVVSDIAPETTGQKSLDQGRSAVMVEQALEIAYSILRRNGNVLVKIFQSGESNDILASMRKKFHAVKIVKPPASKKRSKELYFLGKGFR